MLGLRDSEDTQIPTKATELGGSAVMLPEETLVHCKCVCGQGVYRNRCFHVTDESCQQPPGIATHQHKRCPHPKAQGTAADLPLPPEYSQIKGEKCLKIQLSCR